MVKTATKTQASGSRKRKPKLGQNFLVDVGAARRIVEALGDVSNRTVIEIGPGRGVLTDLLIPRAWHVIGIELDRVLAAQLRMRYATRPNVEILESDFVTAEFASMVGRRPGPAARPSTHAARDRGRGRQPAVLHHLRHRAADSGTAPEHRARGDHGAA